MADTHNSTSEHDTNEQGLKTTSSGGWVLAGAQSPPSPSPTPTTPPPSPSDSESPSRKEEAPDKRVEESKQTQETQEGSTKSKEEEIQWIRDKKVERKPDEWQDVLRLDIKKNLDALAGIAEDVGIHSIKDEIVNERIPSLMEGKFTVVLLGEFNHGKSTVVNALMGENVLPTGITPTTSVITHLTEGTDASVYVKMRRQELKKHVESDKLDALIRDTTDDSIEYVELHRSNIFLKNGLTLVDTPGVNDISKQKVEITYGYLPRADVIIYVLDSTQILKKSEIRFLKDKLLKSKHDHVIFVLGKVDSLTPNEAKEVESYARQKLSEILGHVQLHVFSARDALEKQLKGESPEEAFLTFKKDVLKLVDDNRTFIVFESGISAASRYVTQINQNLSIRKSALSMEVGEINDRLAAVKARYVHTQRAISDTTDFIETKIQEIIATSVNNLNEFSASFVKSLPREIETSAPSDIQTHLPHFIQNAFKEWVEEEGRVLTNRLESLAIEVIEVTNQTMADTLRDLRSELGLSGDVNLDVDTLVYDVSIFALGTAGVAALFVNALVGGLLTLATPILAYYFHSKIGDKVKVKAKEEGVQAIKSATQAIERQLKESIGAYGTRLKAFVESAGDHLFKQISETLESVKYDLEHHPDNIQELSKKTEKEIVHVDKISEALQRLQIKIDNERALKQK